MTDDELYAELRAIAQTLRATGQQTAQRLDQALRAETPDWLLERLDQALRAMDAAAGEVGRFIREDRSGAQAVSPAYLEDE